MTSHVNNKILGESKHRMVRKFMYVYNTVESKRTDLSRGRGSWKREGDVTVSECLDTT